MLALAILGLDSSSAEGRFLAVSIAGGGRLWIVELSEVRGAVASETSPEDGRVDGSDCDAEEAEGEDEAVDGEATSATLGLDFGVPCSRDREESTDTFGLWSFDLD